jgi:hypothetical protein
VDNHCRQSAASRPSPVSRRLFLRPHRHLKDSRQKRRFLKPKAVSRCQDQADNRCRP